MNVEKLTESEEFVMRAIWDCKKEPILQDIVERVNDVYKRNWAPQTVSTFMTHLRRKNYIIMHKKGKVCSYEVKVSKDEYRMRKLKELYMCLYGDDKGKIIQDLEFL